MDNEWLQFELTVAVVLVVTSTKIMMFPVGGFPLASVSSSKRGASTFEDSVIQ